MISLVQASCANYERCQRGETCGTTPCSPCPAQLRKAHEPATEDLGALWAQQRLQMYRGGVDLGGGAVSYGASVAR